MTHPQYFITMYSCFGHTDNRFIIILGAAYQTVSDHVISQIYKTKVS